LVAAAQHGEYARAVGAEARKPRFDRLYVMDTAVPPWRTVESVAEERGMDPVELVIDLAAASDLEQFFFQPLTAEDPGRILPYLQYPRSVMTFSDSGAHVSQISDSSIQTHLLAYWVRERQDFTLAQGVRMLTAAPAGGWGIRDRGLVREGMIADLNVFDPERIAPTMPEVTHDLPGGARRLRQGAEGIRATVVAGEVVLDEGEFTGRLPGRLLRDTGWHKSVIGPEG
jgi:N-acyl-D-aspartate/D-glutamate deacylase